jgi:ribosomal protein S27E
MYSLSRLDSSYQLEVRRFIDAAKRHACREKTKYIYCSCIDCKNIVVSEDAGQIIIIFVQLKMERPLWMYNLLRLDPSYQLEVRRFIDAAKRHACREKTKYIYCPCIDCKNVVVFEDPGQINCHLVCRGFTKDYFTAAQRGFNPGLKGPLIPGCKPGLRFRD